MKTRKAAVAGAFYPRDKEELGGMIDKFLKNVPEIRLEKEPKAFIVPHAGYIYSGQVAAYAYSLLKKYKKEKVILVGPSHYVPFTDFAADDNNYWETPLGKVKLMKNDFQKIEEAHIQEHCLEVQLPFLQKTLKNFEILPLLINQLGDSNSIEKIISRLNDKTLLIISSDLSHFNDYSTAVRIDNNTIKAIQDMDYDKFENEGDACGNTPILVLMRIAKKLDWKPKLLMYKNSGDTSGNKSQVVGYASFAFY